MIFALVVPAYTFINAVLATALFWLILVDWSEVSLAELPDDVAQMLGEPDWWTWCVVVTAVAVAMQAVFLIPVFAGRPPRGERGAPLAVSLGIGALIAAGLVTALAFSLVDALSLLAPERFDLNDKHAALWVFILLVFAGSWGLWTFCLLVFVRGVWADLVLGRMVGLLLSGTALELLVVVPIDVMVRRRTECYCGTGSFFALCIAAAATLWLAGPGIAIALLSRRHKAWRKTHCGRCGYPMGPTPGQACPECGFPWRGDGPGTRG
jgi:hypothetical protein